MSAVDGWTIGHRPSIDDVVSMLAITSSDHGGGPVEAFLRSSTLRKVELDGTTGKTIDRLGREQGGALRWVDERSGTSGFAAASGEAVRALAACRVMAPTAAGKTIDRCPWNVNPASLEDHDLHCVVPGTAELCDWLLATAPDGLDQAWVEAGNSTETWLTGAESVQSRLRGRAWACWMPRESGRHGARPLFLAARNWSALNITATDIQGPGLNINITCISKTKRMLKTSDVRNCSKYVDCSGISHQCTDIPIRADIKRTVIN